LRKLQRAGAELKHYTGEDSRLVRWIYEQKAQQPTPDGANVFSDHERIDFMVAWCAMAGPRCDIFCFEAGSQIISALVTFRDETSRTPARRFYTICFDPHWEKFSPGTLLVYEVTRRSLAEGLDADFMTGEQPHKLRLATTSVPLYRASAQPDDLHALAAELDERARVAA
jgi:CelD/BcsL family acetyltransferase involved in cellulose biosynthesis